VLLELEVVELGLVVPAEAEGLVLAGWIGADVLGIP